MRGITPGIALESVYDGNFVSKHYYCFFQLFVSFWLKIWPWARYSRDYTRYWQTLWLRDAFFHEESISDKIMTFATGGADLRPVEHMGLPGQKFQNFMKMQVVRCAWCPHSKIIIFNFLKPSWCVENMLLLHHWPKSYPKNCNGSGKSRKKHEISSIFPQPT